MSHFCGLVILTPQYSESHGMDDSLERYDENIKMPEYSKGDVSASDIANFLIHYNKERSREAFYKHFYKSRSKSVQSEMREAFKNQTGRELTENDDDSLWNKFYGWTTYMYEYKFGKWFFYQYKFLASLFETLYAEHGEDWNGNRWRKNYATGKWEEYSTYNPDSKWDWYSVGGRWSNAIKTKSGELVDECLLSEIDLEPFPEDAYEDGTDWLGNPCKKLKEGYEWHYTKNEVPFCLVLDGVWYEKGEMGWWGMTSNEKDDDVWDAEVAKLLESLPEDSEVYNVDFHI